MTDFSYQLYSSRNFPPLGDTLRMLAELGYTQVEGYGGLFEDEGSVTALAEGLAETGLAMPSAHIALEMLEDDPDRVLGLADRLGLKALFVPFIPAEERPGDAAGWTALGNRLSTAGAPFWDAGMSFGWHNHDFEFQTVEAQMPLDLILAADTRLALEMDVAWVVRGGQDAATWLQKYSDRIAAVHVKDIAEPGENADQDGWADVGAGTMGWAELLPMAQKTAARYFVMEHDNPSDDRRFAAASLTALRSY